MRNISTNRLVPAILGLALIALAWHFGVITMPHLSGYELVAIGLAGTIGGQMTPAQARVVDPVLTTVAQGHKNGQFVADILFPVVPVGLRGGKIIQFGREDFRLYSVVRAPGANTKRIQYGYAGKPYALEQYALEAVVPHELQSESGAVGIDLAKVSIGKTQDVIALSREYKAAQLATDLSNYDNNHKLQLSGGDKWSDYDGTSNPTKNIDDAIEAIRASTGKRANSVELSPAAFNAARRHPKIIENFKYTGRDSVTVEMLASLWNVERVVVGDAVYDDGKDGFADVWGRDVVVAFTQTAGVADQGLPSYGYTYRLRGYPTVETPYPDRNAKSDIYPVTDELEPVLTSSISGFLIKNAA